MYQTIVEAAFAHAEQTPEKLAVGFKKKQIMYGLLKMQKADI